MLPIILSLGLAAFLTWTQIGASGAGPTSALVSSLRGTQWKLVQLQGSPVEAGGGREEPHLVLSGTDFRISGSGGCNRMTGSFELAGDRIKLPRMATTMMACAAGMEQEQRFLRALERVERFRLQGTNLEFLSAEGDPVARFEAVPPAQ